VGVQVRTSFRLLRRTPPTVQPARDACAHRNPGRVLDAYARQWRLLVERASAELVEEQRATGPAMVADTLAGRHALADGVGEHEARALLFTLLSPDVHRTLTVRRGWPAERYERWLARTMRALLLPHEAEPAPRR
jgi:hypothetical protein